MVTQLHLDFGFRPNSYARRSVTSESYQRTLPESRVETSFKLKREVNMSDSKMAVAAKKRGDELCSEALAKLNTFSLFGFGKAEKCREAAEKYKMAGNSYKMAQAWEAAGDAFMKAYENFKSTGDDKTDAMQNLEDAGHSYKKDRLLIDKAVHTLNMVVESYVTSGRASRAQKCLEAISEIYEAEQQWDDNLSVIEQIVTMLMNDNKSSQATKWQLKMAIILSEKMEAYPRAAEMFKSVGDRSMQTDLGKYAAKGYYFQYLICLVAMGDCVGIEAGLEACKNSDYSFASSRECQFIERLNKAVVDSNNQEYAQACADFDAVTPLDPWKTSLLLKGRSHIPEADVADIDKELDDLVVGDDDDGDDDLK